MRKFFLSVLATVVAFTAAAQLVGGPAPEFIPNDPAVRTGQLENGMKYYIRHNNKQKGLADFYIIHNVGAIQEDDNQQGLAHFLEHMAFNGTNNLPGKMLIEWCERVGIKFGANLNAGTSWDYTQYLIKDVPVSRQGVIDTAMLILHDWSHFITLDHSEIDKERGVIQEELRTRDGASWRSTINLLKNLFKGTKYEHRNLIGHLDGLKSFSYDDIKSFYDKWYRPDYQAVVIVGDIDAEKVEAQVKSLMADIPAPAADAAQKEVIVVPDNKEPIVSIFEDPEMLESEISLFIKRPAVPVQMNDTVQAEMLTLINSLGGTMANARLAEIATKPNAPFTQAYLSNGGVGICPTLDGLTLGVTTKDGGLSEGFAAALTELERIRRHGFTEGEFERAKAQVLRREEQAYNNRNDRMNGQYVQRYLSAFRKNTPFPAAELEWKMDSAIIAQLPLVAINQTFASYITDHNNVVIVNAPKKEGVANPTEAQILEVMAKVKGSQIDPYQDNTVKEPLIAPNAKLKGSKVKKSGANATLGTTEWTLKNGVKVVVKPTTFKADEVQIQMVSQSGVSNLTDEDYYTGKYMPLAMSQMGVGKFSSTELRKQLSGKSASTSVSPDDYTTTIAGNGSPKDLETIMQLLYLRFTAPRFSEDDFKATMSQYISYVENLKSNPDFKASSEQLKSLYNNHYRRQQISTEVLNSIKYERLEPIYRSLTANAANFTVYIVGNVDLATLKPLVEKYIGSLPAKKRKITKRLDDGIRYAKGEVVNDFNHPMQQPKVSVCRIYTGDIEYNLENAVTMNFLQDILRARYTISIREEKGGTYGVGVGGSVDALYNPNYQLVIQFDTNEKMADELSEIVVAELKQIAANGPKSEDLEKVREYLIKEWNNRLVQNGAWMSYIYQNYTYGENMNRVANYENIVKGMTAEKVAALAAKVLADNNMTYVVMRPAK
ncbi:MAG: insulinase family protein [Alistipes sp.]|nr:insulinase family protein [Alistipes sp.]